MKMKPNSNVERFKFFVRTKYAWPGGYPMLVLTDDGEALCKTCAKENAKQIIRATRDRDHSGWACIAVGVNWEDTEMRCCNCDGLIESAYGETK